MAIDGRITCDVLFHDTDGTASLKVVSLEDSTEYTSGKVAIVTGTCGTTEVTVDAAPSSYSDASGSTVSFSSVSRVVLSASPHARAFQEGVSSDAPRLFSAGGQPACCNTDPSEQNDASWFVQTTAGTASYTIVLYGT